MRQLGPGPLPDPQGHHDPRLPVVSLRHVLGEPGDLEAGVGDADEEHLVVDGDVDSELGDGAVAFVSKNLVGWRWRGFEV